jgi:hypothetical protein
MVRINRLGRKLRRGDPEETVDSIEAEGVVWESGSEGLD